MRRPPFARITASLLAAVLAGCSDLSKPAAGVDLSFPFILAEVNGAAIPHRELTERFANGAAVSDSTIISGGAVAFDIDFTMRYQLTLRQKRFQGTQVLSDVSSTPTYTGTWSLSGNKVTMSYVVDGVTRSAVGTVDGGTFTFDDKETYYTSATQTATVTRSMKLMR
jgi:hypothetical protein